MKVNWAPRVGFLVRTLLFVVVDSANIYLYFLYAMRGGGKIVLTIFMILASTLSSFFHFSEKQNDCLFIYLFFKVTD